MPGFEKVRKNLEAHGFDVTCFDTAAEAADYLDRRLDEAEQDTIRGELFTGSVGTAGPAFPKLGSPTFFQAGRQLRRRSRRPGLSDLGQRPGGDRRAHQHRRHGQPGGLHHLRP